MSEPWYIDYKKPCAQTEVSRSPGSSARVEGDLLEPSDSTTTGGVCQAGLRSYYDLIVLCQVPILLRNRNIESMP